MIPKPPVPISPRVKLTPTSRAIDALLPQTQCQRCGYPSCAAYAVAIAEDGAPINQCPPGGDAGIRALSRLTARAYEPLNPQNGVEGSLKIALIDEARCIGCTLCLQACPVDAIVGASKRMHTVIENECSGCELCVPVCPVDCIALIAPEKPLIATDALRERWRARNDAHLKRYWDATEPTPAPKAASSRAQMLARAIEKAKTRV